MEKSDLPQQSYCVQEKINYGTFVYWRSQFLAELGQTKARQFLPVKIKSVPSDVSESIKVKLTSGNIVIIPFNIGISEVAKLIFHLEKMHA